MSRSLFTGAAGLLAHQRKLDVVSNNLANLNTVGYKTSRINFADLLYQTVNTASGSSDPRFSGTNPSEVGNGVKVAQISRKFEQGVLQATGETFDYAIVGNGFFVVSDSVQNYFTRDGGFAVNSAGYLVSNATGFLVQRNGSLGEPSDNVLGFQVPGDTGIRVPLGTTIPGSKTTLAEFSGNLPTTARPPQTEILASFEPFEAGGAAATAATLLNNLDSNTADYVVGDDITISGTNFDGTTFSTTFAVTPTTTVGDLVAAINGAITGGTASLDANGTLVLTADTTGATEMAVLLRDAAGNTGATNLNIHDLRVDQNGTNGDTVDTTVQFFDERGQQQNFSVQFRKTGINTWDATFQTAATANGDVIVDGTVTGIEFNDDGSFRRINGTGTGDSRVVIDFAGITDDQVIDLDFSSMSHTPANFSAFIDQDGFPIGLLASVSVGGNGVLEGISTNGVRIPIAQMAIASFRNDQGLSSGGNNLYEFTVASGEPQYGPGLTGNRGQVVGGNLEQSNVDMAFEFTQLIIAQRGFSANARTITITDNMLEELTNIVR